VWKLVPPSVSYYQLGAAALLRAARELGMERARELKYTAARRRGWEAVGRVVEEIAREFQIDYEVLHAERPSDRLRALIAVAKRLVERARRRSLRPRDRRSAARHGRAPQGFESIRGGLRPTRQNEEQQEGRGLQLADLVAGFVRKQYLKGSASAR
jgi:hypothetical protein